MPDLNLIISEIKKKRELSGIDDSVVGEAIKEYLFRHNFSDVSSSKTLKIVVKDIRAQLRRCSGRFQASSAKRIKLLKEDNLKGLLESHSSSKERLEAYPRIKEIISNLNVHSILDLGCGLNPLALASPGIFYYASDIKSDELEIVRAFFEKHQIPGKVFVHDIRKINEPLPQADLVLLLKVLDVVEHRRHKLSEEILKSLNCKYLLISFPTKTLSGKPMNHPQRGWIERLLSRLGYTFKYFFTKNEAFYLVKKRPETKTLSPR